MSEVPYEGVGLPNQIFAQTMFMAVLPLRQVGGQTSVARDDPLALAICLVPNMEAEKGRWAYDSKRYGQVEHGHYDQATCDLRVHVLAWHALQYRNVK